MPILTSVSLKVYAGWWNMEQVEVVFPPSSSESFFSRIVLSKKFFANSPPHFILLVLKK